MNTPWMQPAFDALLRNVREIPGDSSNPEIDEWLASVGQPPNDEIHNCSAYVNYMLESVMIEGTRKANARSWLAWGDPCDLTVGAIGVMWRGSPDSWMGHVGFVVGWNSVMVYLLGANQGDKVSVAAYPRDRFLGFRLPKVTRVT